MSATLSPVPKLQFFDANGAPLVGGKLYSYTAGTTSPLATYVDSAGTTTNTNPVILDSRGEANVWLGAATYKLALYSATNVLIWTVDDIDNEDSLTVTGISGTTLNFTNGTVNGSIATTLGSVGPTGSTAGNPQGWILINVAGTDRYVPYW